MIDFVYTLKNKITNNINECVLTVIRSKYYLFKEHSQKSLMMKNLYKANNANFLDTILKINLIDESKSAKYSVSNKNEMNSDQTDDLSDSSGDWWEENKVRVVVTSEALDMIDKD